METKELETIPAGMPLREGEAIVVKDGYAYAATPDETPVAVCTIDCTTNATGVLAPFTDK